MVKKLSLIQVGQLLLIRQGAYDKVGIYYDASASAYQIMGTLTGDKELCQLTNVFSLENNIKNDIYNYFLDELNKTIWDESYDTAALDAEDAEHAKIDEKPKKVNQLDSQERRYLRNNFNRKLVKAIVMPLIYGKTGAGFVENLKEFFKKGGLAGIAESHLHQFATKTIKELKAHPMLKKLIGLMKQLRIIANMLYEFNLVDIMGPYNDFHIQYHQEKIQRLYLYLKVGKRYRTKRVSISQIARDESGVALQSKTKTLNSFVANYVHFLDGVICHYISEELSKAEDFSLGTIHDCFFIKPEKAEIVNNLYRKGLVIAVFTHQSNLLNWVLAIIPNTKCKKTFDKDKLITCVQTQLKNVPYISGNYTGVKWGEVIEQLELFKENLTLAEYREKWAILIEYIKIYNTPDFCDFIREILDSEVQSIFPDNK